MYRKGKLAEMMRLMKWNVSQKNKSKFTGRKWRLLGKTKS